MIDPGEPGDPKFPVRLMPRFVGRTGLHHPPPYGQGAWAQARGLLEPFILADRLAETREGFQALAFHETLHCVERHALASLLILLSPIVVAFPIALLVSPLLAWAGIGAGVLAWAWWQREREIRADAFAWRGAGPQRFYAFLAMLEHPSLDPTVPAGWGWLQWARVLAVRATHAWYRWVYGRTVEARATRAARRAERTRWVVAPPLLLPRASRASPSRSSSGTEASSSAPASSAAATPTPPTCRSSRASTAPSP